MSIDKKILIFSYLFFAIFLMGAIFPDAWWGIHFIAFLPPLWKYGLLAVSGSLIAISHFFPEKLETFKSISLFPKGLKQWIFAAVILIILFRMFPIAVDIFGDAPAWKAFSEKVVEKVGSQHYQIILDPNVFNPKTGVRTVMNSISSLSLWTGMKAKEVFYWMGALSGTAFILLWLYFIKTYIKDRASQNLLALLGCTAPVIQLFFGHIEIYPPFIPAILAYFIALFSYFRKGKKRYLGLMSVLMLLTMKLHTTGLFLLPSFLFAVVFHFLKGKSLAIQTLNWKKIALGGLLPIFALGACAYFFLFQDYSDPRFLNDNVSELERLFLPILSPEAPLDRYTLFHSNHLLDYFNALLHCSAPALFLFGTILLFFRKQINWNQPEILVTGFTLALLVAFFFMVNPLVSMPFDWDLFILPAPVVLVFIVLLIKQLQHTAYVPKVIGASLALMLLSIPAFMVNSSEESLSYRLESMGKHSFKTYWIRSTYGIETGIGMMQKYPELYAERLQKNIEELREYAHPGNDIEYAKLCMHLGQHYLYSDLDYPSAKEVLERGLDYYEGDKPSLLALTEANFMSKEYQKAFQLSQRLVELEYPNKQHAYRMSIHCALEANKVDTAKDHCKIYNNLWPGDEDIRRLYAKFESNEPLDSLKNVFILQ